MTTPRLAILQRRFPTPQLSPLGLAVDTMIQDAHALDLTIDNCADSMTGDEGVEFASIMAMVLTCCEALREVVQAREARLTSTYLGK